MSTPRKIIPLSEDMEFILMVEPSSIVCIAPAAYLHDVNGCAIAHSRYQCVNMSVSSPKGATLQHKATLWWED